MRLQTQTQLMLEYLTQHIIEQPFREIHQLAQHRRACQLACVLPVRSKLQCMTVHEWATEQSLCGLTTPTSVPRASERRHETEALLPPQRHGPQVAQHDTSSALNATIHVQRLRLRLALRARGGSTR